MKLFPILLLGLLYSAQTSNAQPGVLPDAPVFTLDIETLKTEGSIDFDRPFRLFLTSVPAGVDAIITNIFEGRTNDGSRISSTETSVPNAPKEGTFSVSVIPAVTLRANGSYRFQIQLLSVTLDTTGVRTVQLMQTVDYAFSLKTKLGDYLKLDLGLGYAPNIKGVVSQAAIHMYLLPVNNDLDMATVDGFAKNIFLRTSVFVGISPVTLYSDTEQPIINSSSAGNLVFGIGIRSPFYGRHMPFERNVGWVFLQPLRVNIGQIYFRQDDANPLITKNKNKLAFYFGISYDVSIAGLLGPVGKLVTP